MLEIFSEFRDLNTLGVLVRLVLAMFFGGIVGLERGRKRRAAGFRTYMLVCMGAALTMMLGQYLYQMLATRWTDTVLGVDVARFGAQVINGVGFLGAGTIVVTGRQQVKGLTTAAGLWASACMGLAIGAGFYECILLGLALIILCVVVLPHVETGLIERSKSMNLYVEFDSLDHIGAILGCVKNLNVHIYDVDIEREKTATSPNPSVVISMRLKKRMPHSEVLASVSSLDCIRMIEEI